MNDPLIIALKELTDQVIGLRRDLHTQVMMGEVDALMEIKEELGKLMKEKPPILPPGFPHKGFHSKDDTPWTEWPNN